MEVSGRKMDNILCESCCEDGQKLLAFGFCVDCCEYLCSTCYKHHCNPRPCRDHVLQDKETMPRTKPDSMTTEITDTGDKCSKHRGETIKFYCRSDRQLGCGSCMTINHRKCIEILSIEEQYEKFENEMKDFGLQIDKNFRTKDQNNKEIDNIHSKAVKDIKLFMSEIKQFFESLENRMIKDADNLKDRDEKKMKNISDTCMTLRNDLRSLTILDLSKLHQTQQNGKLFTIMEEAKDQMKTIAKEIDKMNNDNKVEKYTFVPEKQIQELIGNMSALGKLNTELKPYLNYQTEIQKTSDEGGSLSAKTSKIQSLIAKTTHGQTTKQDTNQTSTSQSTTIPKVSISCKSTQETFKPRQVSVVSDINVQSSTDIGTLYITGMAILTDDQFLVTDYSNNIAKVKLVNTKQNKIVTEIKLSSQPWDITTVSNNLVAVTMPYDNQIQLLSVLNKKLSQGQTIKVKGSCRGIVHNDGTLIVTYGYPVKLEMLTMRGNVLKVIDKGPLFVDPNYIAISPDKTHVYISDNDDFSVTCMTLDGKVKGVYKDDDLCRPCGLTVDKTGTVHVVCAWTPNYMYQISRDCSQGQKLLRSKILMYRQSIAYCHKMDKLYVDSGKIFIQVCQLK